MSSINPPIDSPVKFEGKSPLEIIADSGKLKIETAEIDERIKAVESTPLSGEVLSPPTNDSNEMLGEVLNELRQMRREIREIKKDVSVMKSELESQKQINNHFEEKVSSNLKDSKKEPMVNCDTDIRRQINGKWRNVESYHLCFSAKFEDDKFMQKWRNSTTSCKLGVKYQGGLTVTVENNKIVQKRVSYNGEEQWRDEFFIENERLQIVYYAQGKEWKKCTFQRIGDPDP